MLVALCAIVLLQLWRASHDPRELDDFITYWTTGRLNAHGVNPYDADRVLALERSVGWTKPFSYRIWYPPWTIALFMPIGALSEPAARFAWWLLVMAIVVGSADRLWRAYGGEPAKRGVAWLTAATFAPAIIVWKTGQVAPLMLLGVVGFLAATRRGRPIAAGVALALAAAKPQVVYLLWPALVLLAARTRDARALVGLGGALVVLLAAATATNPDVVSQFVTVNRLEPPHMLAPPYVLPSSPGSALRWVAVHVAGRDVPALQFVPIVAGGAWLWWYWCRRGARWDWLEELPLVLLMSFATTSWCWVYDEVLLLVPLVQRAVMLWRRPWTRAERGLVAAYAAVDAAIFAADLGHAHATSYVWTQYAFLALYLGTRPPGPISPRSGDCRSG